MIKLKDPIELEIKTTYSHIFKEGDSAKIDMIQTQEFCQTGIMVRVIDKWSKPRFLDLDWFYDDENLVRNIIRGNGLDN